MATRREMLDADLKEVLDHLNAFPGDSYATAKLEKIQYAIEALTPPMMSHQRQRAELSNSPHPLNIQDWASFILSLPPSEMMHARTRKAIADEEAAKPRYTFGADYEMDQRWLAAEREKVDGLPSTHMSAPVAFPSRQEADMFLFPSSAFCLTDMANVRYGRLG